MNSLSMMHQYEHYAFCEWIFISDYAGWWVQGAESPGCQEANSEDDGGEGKALSAI